MPTPACLATASRLASGPPALNTAFAASSTRSRLRTASTRGLLAVLLERSPLLFVTGSLEKRRNPPYLARGRPQSRAVASTSRRRRLNHVGVGIPQGSNSPGATLARCHGVQTRAAQAG